MEASNLDELFIKETDYTILTPYVKRSPNMPKGFYVHGRVKFIGIGMYYEENEFDEGLLKKPNFAILDPETVRRLSEIEFVSGMSSKIVVGHVNKIYGKTYVNLDQFILDYQNLNKLADELNKQRDLKSQMSYVESEIGMKVKSLGLDKEVVEKFYKK